MELNLPVKSETRSLEKTSARLASEVTSLEKKLKELDDLEAALTKQASNLAQAELEYYNKNLIEYFHPSPKQLRFFQHSLCKRRAVFAGNRFGKTELGSVEDVSWLLGERRFFPEGSPLRRKGIPSYGVKILVIAEDWDLVGELFTNEAEKLGKAGKIMRYLPSDAKTSFHKNQNGIIDIIYVEVILDGLVRKSAIFFDTVKSFKNNPKSFESKDWDLIHLDEPVPEELWKAISRGLIDRAGSLIALLTPLSEAWLYYMFSESVSENTEENGVWWCEASIWDNPTLTKEAIEDYFKNVADPAERACRETGRPLVQGNLVISTYDERKHLWQSEEPTCPLEHKGVPAGWKDAYTPPKDYYCGYAIDTHPQTPTAVLFFAIAPQGQVFFYDELWIGDLKKDRISEVAKEIRLRANKVSCELELCEPAAWNLDPETGRCFADIFYENGLFVSKASKERTYAIQQTRILFASDRKVFVMSHCRNLRKELKRWSFTREDKPEDKNDHFCECLGRIVVFDNLTYHIPNAMRNVRGMEEEISREVRPRFSSKEKATLSSSVLDISTLISTTPWNNYN